jgi:hypothetical protein
MLHDRSLEDALGIVEIDLVVPEIDPAFLRVPSVADACHYATSLQNIIWLGEIHSWFRRANVARVISA